MANIKKIKLPNGTEYDIKDSGALPLTGGTVTGPVIFQDTTSMDEATIGDLVVNGNASFTNNIQANTINGVTVGSSPKFTDTNTVTTATTTGSGNAVTAITASNGALTVTKGTTFLTSHQDISGKADKSATVSTVAYDSTNAKITKTINGTTSDVVSVATLKTALGSMPASDVYSWAKASSKPTYTASEVGALASNTTYVSKITTTAGAHSAISNQSGAVSFNVPTTAAHVGIKFGFTTNGNSRAVQQDSNGNLYVIQKDDNDDTTYSAGGGLTLSGTIFSSNNSNLVNGSSSNSVRGTGTTSESSSYTMGSYAFAEGGGTKASGVCSHAEGSGSIASGTNAHAEGAATTASGNHSHAEGAATVASGDYSHAQNSNTIAQRASQTTLGEYNIADTGGNNTTSKGDYVVIVGNGSNSAHSNALTIDWNALVNTYQVAAPSGSTDPYYDTGYRATNNTTGSNLFFGIGAGGTNRGIYDTTSSEWMIYKDTNDKTRIDELYINNHTSPIGTVKTGYLPSDKSVANNSYVSLCSVSLDKGVWIITGGVRWNTSANGSRDTNISTTKGDTSMQLTVQPNSNNWTQTNLTRIVSVSVDGTTYHLNARQTSGNALTARAGETNGSTYITAVRIA